MKRFVFLLLLIVGCKPTQPKPPPVNPADTEAVRLLYDAHLVARGSAALYLNDKLCNAAQAHADWMAANRRMSHTGAGGSSFADRAREHGYNIRGGGENVAAGYSSVEAVMRGWMNSPGHRRNILNRSWRDAGFGVAKAQNGQLYWSATFATGSGSSAAQTPLMQPGPLSN